MSFWKKKPIPEPVKELAKRTKTLQRTEQKFNVCRTEVKLTFDNGDTFGIVLVGNVDQSTYRGRDESSPEDYTYYPVQEPEVRDPIITTSLAVAKKFMKKNCGFSRDFINDMSNPTAVYHGKAIKAELGETESFEVTYQVASVIEVGL